VNRAKSSLEELAADPGAPTDVRIEAADGYLRLAGVLGFSSAGQLGLRAEADAMMVGRSGCWTAFRPPNATRPSGCTWRAG
jgi:hypothetical protein